MRMRFPSTVRIGAAMFSAVACLQLVSGCGLLFDEHDLVLEITGPAGAAASVTYSLPGEDGWTTPQEMSMPLKKSVTTGFGMVGLSATPKPGVALSCSISSDGVQVASKTGAAGAEISCSAMIKED